MINFTFYSQVPKDIINIQEGDQVLTNNNSTPQLVLLIKENRAHDSFLVILGPPGTDVTQQAGTRFTQITKVIHPSSNPLYLVPTGVPTPSDEAWGLLQREDEEYAKKQREAHKIRHGVLSTLAPFHQPPPIPETHVADLASAINNLAKATEHLSAVLQKNNEEDRKMWHANLETQVTVFREHQKFALKAMEIFESFGSHIAHPSTNLNK